MRYIVMMLVVGVLGYGGYRYWDSPEDDSPGLERVPAEPVASAVPPRELSAPPAAVQTAPPPPSEESELRERVEETTSPEGDADRWRLCQLLIAKGNTASVREAERILAEIVGGEGEHAPWAASALFRRAAGGEARLQQASAVVALGERAPAYIEALSELGRSHLGRTEDSEQVRAWELLSQAYFATEDPEFRRRTRADLDPLVQSLILSPRRTQACGHCVVSGGDHLVKIAKTHGTTVDALRFLNQIEGDLIHAGQSLKVLKGKITIEVDKSEFWLDARLDGKYLFGAPVGLGQHGKTPIGTFVIGTLQKEPAWHKRGQRPIPYGDPDNPLGERWLGFKDTEDHTGFGIHGTDDPATIGTESSAGCIRLRNEDVVALYRLIPRGTEVIVRE